MPQGLLEVQVVWWLTFFALLLWGFQPAVHHQHTLVSNTVFELHIYIYMYLYIYVISCGMGAKPFLPALRMD